MNLNTSLVGIIQYSTSASASTSTSTSIFSQDYYKLSISSTIQSNTQYSSYLLYNLDQQLARLIYTYVLLYKQLVRYAFWEKVVALLTFWRLQIQVGLRAIFSRLLLLKIQTLAILNKVLTRLQNQLQIQLSQNTQLKGTTTTIQLLVSQRVAYIYII